MKKKKDRYAGIPAPGTILRYLVRAFGLPTKEIAGITDQDFARISAERTSPEKWWKVVKAIVDRLVLPDSSSPTPSPTDIAMEEFSPASPFAHRYKADATGEIIFDPTELSRLIHEFLMSNLVFRLSLGDTFVGPQAREVWVRIYVIPFLAGKAAELRAIGVDWESGMPGGYHWYLPRGAKRDKTGKVQFWGFPSQLVLEWWQDLLGSSLNHFPLQLCGADSPEAQRQINRWLKSNYPPDYATVERWTNPHVQWHYDGVFEPDRSAPLARQWEHCREFLKQKRMMEPGDWRKDLGLSAHADSVRQFYRGEKLEEEIPPFKKAGIPFSAFFESSDPIGAGLPVHELVDRVAYRWRRPTNLEVRVRLLIAGTAQRAVNDLAAEVGIERALADCGWFARSFDVIRAVVSDPEMLANDAKATGRKLVARALAQSPAECAILSAAFEETLEPSLALMATAYRASFLDHHISNPRRFE